ncbi:Cellulose-growth-specific protein [Paramyrothecium foliicola]|nr:Cellulose-growth-specific protein [Paramyrothecium foliicola]
MADLTAGCGTDQHRNYPFWLEDQQPDSIQRRWFPDPIQDVGHPYLSCNRGNPLATRNPSLHAPIEAGTNLTVRYPPPPCPKDIHQPTEPSVPWKNEPVPAFRCHGPEYPWVHALGPLLAYMAPCNGPCEDFDPADGKVWFKVYESGFHGGTDYFGDVEYKRDIASGHAWAQSTLPNKGWSLRIPKNLKPGNYLIRHEIIMIELFPPQHYPNCAQLTVTGNGDRLPSEDFLVSFPGAYSYDEPGLAIAGEVYSPIGHSTYNYTIPGPKLWTAQLAFNLADVCFLYKEEKVRDGPGPDELRRSDRCRRDMHVDENYKAGPGKVTCVGDGFVLLASSQWGLALLI